MFHHSRSVLDRINNIYLQEAALYSDHLEVAGRVDCIAEFDGVLSIIDFKTAEPKKETYLYDYLVQETAYACCLQEALRFVCNPMLLLLRVKTERRKCISLLPKKNTAQINPVHRRIPKPDMEKKTLLEDKFMTSEVLTRSRKDCIKQCRYELH